MIGIGLTRGMITMVDDEDAELLSRHKWYAFPGNARSWYAVCHDVPERGRRLLFMHRLILLPPSGLCVDHIDGDGLNNRRENLRLATASENKSNSLGRINHRKSKFKGVRWHHDTRLVAGGYWRAYISVHGKVVATRTAPNETAAALVYNEFAKRYHGDFARLNEVSVP